ncbi:HpaII family restriction endonuclease [Pseudanabaena galeata UHCC 0370]|uniref:HpaII family restriction endonuclease n=1 Tax=Pseudanabaena galeata UHCC 0370 TaxID=3110310 RepID=A0ABU5TNN3_9CYAN|nr:HpaII family restriction endonuclease [Pseudanabaena galeata]MEA5479879.1 HpaII family restriction endonuclease [Pseudanabaena galeata UHCC 0370]
MLHFILELAKLCAGDKDLNKILSISYPVIEVFNGDESNFTRYQLDLINQVVNIYVGDSLDSFPVSISEFTKYSDLLLTKIKNSKGSSFEIGEVENFISQIKLYRIASSSNKKVDIQALIDSGDKNLIKLGFSIKSWLGSMPTLLNATGATNFIFEIRTPQELDFKEIENANKIKNFYEKFLYLQKHNINLLFSHISRQNFYDNLVLIDSQLPQILAHILEDHYSSQKVNKISDLVSRLTQKNPLQLSNKYFYEKKIRDFLSVIALGMMPNTPWNGYHSINGGHIIVSKTGEILTYFYIYFPQEFEDYLFNRTKLERGSTKRHKFGEIYFDETTNRAYINLNLQIRFF